MRNEPNRPASKELRAKLIGETARAPWVELQRFFAQGIVLAVAPGLDLIDVAVSIAEDNSDEFSSWWSARLVARVTDEQAMLWLAEEASVWTVVIRPWVLVQAQEPRKVARPSVSQDPTD